MEPMNGWIRRDGGVDYHPQGAALTWTAEDFECYLPPPWPSVESDSFLNLFRLYIDMGDAPIDAYGKVLRAYIGEAP